MTDDEPCVCGTDFTCMASHIADRFERERDESCEAILRIEPRIVSPEEAQAWLDGPQMVDICYASETLEPYARAVATEPDRIRAAERRGAVKALLAAARPAANVDVAAIRAALAKASRGPWEGDARFQAIRDGAGDWAADIAWEGDLELIVLLRNNAEALLDAVEGSAATSGPTLK